MFNLKQYNIMDSSKDKIETTANFQELGAMLPGLLAFFKGMIDGLVITLNREKNIIEVYSHLATRNDNDLVLLTTMKYDDAIENWVNDEAKRQMMREGKCTNGATKAKDNTPKTPAAKYSVIPKKRR